MADLGASDPACSRAPGSQSAHPPTVAGGGNNDQIKGGQGDFLTVIKQRHGWKHNRAYREPSLPPSPRFKTTRSRSANWHYRVLSPPDPIRSPRAEVPLGRGSGRLVGQALGRRGDRRCGRPAPLRLCGRDIGRCFCVAPAVRRSPCTCLRGRMPRYVSLGTTGGVSVRSKAAENR